MIRRLFVALMLAGAAPVSAQTFAIVGGTVALGDGSQPIPNGMVVVRDGRIVAAGDIRIANGVCMKTPQTNRSIAPTISVVQ